MIVRAEFVPIESRALITIDWASQDFEQLPPLALESADEAIVRLRYTATAEEQRRIDIPNIRRQLLDAGAHAVQIDYTPVRADRARVEGLDDSMSELDALDEWTRVNGVDELLAGLMREKTRDYLAAIA